jgi:hypothetical protein
MSLSSKENKEEGARGEKRGGWSERERESKDRDPC